jgi:hypothetical protein
MPAAATRRTAKGSTTKAAPASSSTGNRVQALRFVASAHEHREPIITQSVTPGAAPVQSNPSNIPIPAYGFLGHVILLVQWTGGAGGVLSADAPWNFFQSVAIQDVNGAYLQNPVDGFSLLMENVYGGYAYKQDPRLSPIYSAGTTAGTFMLRVPVMVTRHNAYGSLANQNAAAPYQLSYTINPSTTIWSTAPTTIPSFTVYAYLEAWSQPNARDTKGRAQAQLPPLHGSTQQWSIYTKAIAAGNNVTQLPRVGNTVRTIICICRDGTGARNSAVFPTPFSFNLDSRVLTSEVALLRAGLQTEGLSGTSTLDAGVYVFYYNNSIVGHIGDETSDLWLPTVQSTRLELSGNSSTAGNIEFLTNDIVQVETDQAARYVMDSQTGDLSSPDLVAA